MPPIRPFVPKSEIQHLTDEEAMQTLTAGWDMLMKNARVIALLPIEEWLTALERAETVGPYVDPTLFRDYLYSNKGPILKKIMAAALTLKQTLLEVQPQLKDMLEKEQRRIIP